MKKFFPILAAFCLALAAPSLIYAQSTAIALNIGPSGFNCGAYTGSYYCYGLPVVTVADGVAQNGSLWTDNYAASHGGKGFVLFSGVNIGQAIIESVTSIEGGLQEQLSGPGYTGTLTLYFTTYYSRGGGGRGCGGCGTKWTALPSSTLTIEWQ